MPSGFQNDTNQLQAEMYKVIITMSNATYYPTTGADGGGVTPNSADSFATMPTTTAKGQLRARGNMRFRNVVNHLTGLGDCQIRDVTMTGETVGDDQASVCQFTVAFDRPQFIALTGETIGSTTVGNDIAGASMNTRAKRIANEVALGIRDTTSGAIRVYDGTAAQDTQQSISVTTTGATAAQTLGTVAVTLIDESTLFD